MKTVFITYGDDKYTKPKIRIMNEAKAFGFDTMLLYERKDLSPEFIERSQIDFNARGGGHWMYKPYVLNEALKHMEIDDIGVYCDAGCSVLRGLEEDAYWTQFLTLLDSSGYHDLLMFEQPYKEYAFTKIELFDRLAVDITSPAAQSLQTLGGIFMFRKTPAIVALFQTWLDILYENPVFFNDSYTRSQHPGFIDHRHDQSVLSLLAKLHGGSTRVMHTPAMPFKISRKRE